jgi:hypothetical protein
VQHRLRGRCSAKLPGHVQSRSFNAAAIHRRAAASVGASSGQRMARPRSLCGAAGSRRKSTRIHRSSFSLRTSSMNGFPGDSTYPRPPARPSRRRGRANLATRSSAERRASSESAADMRSAAPAGFRCAKTDRMRDPFKWIGWRSTLNPGWLRPAPTRDSGVQPCAPGGARAGGARQSSEARHGLRPRS